MTRNHSGTIDHRFFPHIIDLIWSYMPYPSLVMATMVCKAWCEDAKKRLLELGHVSVMEGDNTDYAITIRSRNTAWPDHSSLLATAKEKDLPNYYNVMKVIDLVPNPKRHPLDPVRDSNLLLDLSGLYQSRVHIPPGVEMSHFYHMSAVTTICFLDYTRAYCLSRADRFCGAPYLTLSIDCYSDPTAPMSSMHWEPWYLGFCTAAEYLEKFTVILNDRRGEEPPPKVRTAPRTMQHHLAGIEGWFLDRELPELGGAYEVLRIALRASEVDEIRVVGAELFVNNEDLDLYLGQLQDELTLEAETLTDSPQHGNDLGDCIKFYTHVQYRELVGEGQYILDTVR